MTPSRPGAFRRSPMVRRMAAMMLAWSCAACLDGGSGQSGEVDGGGEARRPNILLVAVDTLRRDHCSTYGYERPTTPFLEKLASEGVKFDNHFSGGPWTTPSFATLFTGRSAAEHGLDSVRKRLPENLPTVAERLRDAGYHTLGVLCNPCAAGRLGFSRGFDRYDDFTIALDLEVNLFGRASAPRRVNEDVTGPAITRLFLKHLANRPKDKPWFGFVLYYDPHLEYTPTEEYRRMFSQRPDTPLPPQGEWTAGSPVLEEAAARYDAEIRATDDEIAGLLARLREAGHFTDDDLLIWTSDHGEEFRDHDGLLHGNTYFDEIVRVPLVLRWPGRLPGGRTVRALTAHEDMGSAILAAAGAGAEWHKSGADILSLARGTTDAGREGLGLAGDARQAGAAWRTKDWLLVRDRATGRSQAWHLPDDPGQHHPLDPAAHPESVRLAEALDAWWRSESSKHPDAATATPPALTAREKATLKALGYLQD